MRMELQNVAGIETEDYMPPDGVLRARVDFFYTDSGTADPDKFWKTSGKEWFEASEHFIGRRKADCERCRT